MMNIAHADYHTRHVLSSEKLVPESAPPSNNSLHTSVLLNCTATGENNCANNDDLCDDNASIETLTMTSFALDACLVGTDKQVVPHERSRKDKSMDMSNSGTHTYPTRDSTDILLRKNSLLTVHLPGKMAVEGGSDHTHTQTRQLATIPRGNSCGQVGHRSPARPTHQSSVFISPCLSPSFHSCSLSSLITSRTCPSSHKPTKLNLFPVLVLTCMLNSVVSSPLSLDISTKSTSNSMVTSPTPLTTPAHIHGSSSSHQSHHNLIQDRLNPIELKLLDHLINNQQVHHRVYHHKPSPYASEHIFDPSSEEISLKLENSARTVPNSQKRDIHVPMHVSESMLLSANQARQHSVSGNNVNSAVNEAMTTSQHHPHLVHHHQHHSLHQRQPPQTFDEASQLDNTPTTFEQERMNPTRALEAAEMTKEIPKWLYWLHPARTHLTLSEAHALVKSVINHGLVEKLDFKKLQQLTRKYFPDEMDKDEDFIDLHSETSNESSRDNEDPLNPEEELLTINRSKQVDESEITVSAKEGQDDDDDELLPQVDPKQNQISSNDKMQQAKTKGAAFASAILNEDLFKNYENLEQVMEILMHSENTLKKRGEGPQLSIDSALTVLRERLLLELARRKAKATQEQIALNSRILEKLGRRRRRRSVDVQLEAEHKPWKLAQLNRAQTRTRSAHRKRSGTVNCDEVKCTLDDLNSKWSNLHESLLSLTNDYNTANLDSKQSQHYPHIYLNYHVKPYYYPSGSSPVLKHNPAPAPQQQRFRNNDKYIAFDDDEPQDDSTLQDQDEQSNLEAKSHETHEIVRDLGRIEPNKDRLAYMQSGTSTGSSNSAKPSDRARINSRKPVFVGSSGRSSSASSSSAKSSPSSAISSAYYYRRHPKLAMREQPIETPDWTDNSADDSNELVDQNDNDDYSHSVLQLERDTAKVDQFVTLMK